MMIGWFFGDLWWNNVGLCMPIHDFPFKWEGIGYVPVLFNRGCYKRADKPIEHGPRCFCSIEIFALERLLA